jgi:hypothetical protein
MSKDKLQLPLDIATFLRVQKWYLFALAAIAFTIIFAQVLIQRHLNSQLNDSRVINIAGRQRAYSQKLVKEVLLLKTAQSKKERQDVQSELHETLEVWKTSHEALQSGNETLGIPVDKDEEIGRLFSRLTPYHRAMVGAVETILTQMEKNPGSLPLQFEADMTTVLQNECTFLKVMDTIVNDYDRHSREQLQNLNY